MRPDSRNSNSKPRYSASRRSRRLLLGLLAGLAVSAAACSVSSSSSSGSLNPRQLLSAGLAAQNQGALATAKDDYQSILQIDPSNASGVNKYAYYNLGVIAQQQGDKAGASTNYNKAIAIDSNFTNAIYNLAVLETTTNPTDAESLYRRVLVIKPDDVNSNYNLGLLLYQSGNKAAGIPLLQKAFSVDPALRNKLPAGVQVP